MDLLAASNYAVSLAGIQPEKLPDKSLGFVRSVKYYTMTTEVAYTLTNADHPEADDDDGLRLLRSRVAHGWSSEEQR